MPPCRVPKRQNAGGDRSPNLHDWHRPLDPRRHQPYRVRVPSGGRPPVRRKDVGLACPVPRLAAGSFAATRELARRIGEIEFNALYHQGNGSHIFMNSVDEETIMITVFGPRTTVGLVRFYSTGTAQQVALLLKSLQKGNHGFSFNASDITAAPIFADAPPAA